MQDSPWTLRWEELRWDETPDAVAMTRAERAAWRSHYRAAVPPRIAGLSFEIESEVLAAADDARAEVSRFDAELAELLPGTQFTPLSSVLLRTESASSSQIENITAGAKALALAQIGHAKFGSNAGLVARNVDAMNRAIELAGSIDESSILAVHESLTRDQSYAAPGQFRRQQVWIGGATSSPHTAQFVPPHHSRVPDAVRDLCTFIERTDIPLVAHAALAHAQFETIHPFNDGNGRTGRALVHAMLKQGGATTHSTVPISAGLLSDTDGYIAALTAYRNGNLSPIVERFAVATFAAITNSRALAHELRQIHGAWSERLTMRRGAAAWRALSLLLAQPAVTSAIVQDQLGLSQPAADALIKRLHEAQILSRASGTRRYIVWVAEDVTAALDRFAERARRRT